MTQGRGKFVLGRIAQALPTLFGLTIIAFLLIHLVPGDPGRIALGQRAPETAVKAFDRGLGLGRPLTDQYWHFLENAVQLKFGNSFSQHQSVGAVLSSAAPPTALLILYSMVLALLIAVPVAIAVAIRANRPLDHAVRAVGMVLFTMPTFWLGVVLVVLLSLIIPIFPVSGYQTGVVGALKTLTLPALTLALGTAAFFIRTLRASLIEGLSAGYVDAARGRGFTEPRVLYRHVLRPSSVPLVTVAGLTIGWLLSWTVVVENVFGIPGIGSALVTGVADRDFPLVQGIVLILGVAVVMVNLLTDLAYAAIDPRVKL